MEEDWTPVLGAAPLLAIAAGAIALILVLIIRFEVHAFLTLVIVSLLTAVAAQIPLENIASVATTGFGSTLANVALLIGFGAMLGRLVEHSGGAQALADKLVSVFGEKRAPFALGIASLILGFPMFFDAGLIMMLPIVFAVARRVSGNNVLLFGLPAAAAFSVMHVFLPPHPGPVSATEFYGGNLGIVLLLGLIIVFPVWYLSGYAWGKFVSNRIKLPVPALFGEKDDDLPSNPPKVSTVILLLLLPMLLIFLNTGLTSLGSAGVVDTSALWARIAILLGNSPVALLIAVVVATIVLGFRRGEKGSAIEKIVDSALGPISSVVLITGAGGMFGAVLRESGIGDALADTLDSFGMPVIIAAYVIAVVIRLAQGSATVALVTAAGLVAPAVLEGGFNEFQIAAITLATAAGSVFAGHVNDSGFWLVGRLMGMDVKTTLKTWTVQQTIESLVAFAFVLAIYGVASIF
ncbi:GntP family permease [Mycetocola reblochoni]|uniref:Low-affinity gluconate/H+ symporter GntU n=2 Tax=Mycetocola reblochoni TaxID=331618 RepID=A0A1R4KCK4_9MICO|nr:GntP family permease [Mycetocola reblochoni]RLP69276.1 GntP family permease [Mycetocola reblochoni]SJN42036.1 Low-affinity gluconate/H+ symporter GntU [Mycetocola reblochoni REB411]